MNETRYSASLNGYESLTSEEDELNFHEEEPLTILLKPGHYDALYSTKHAEWIKISEMPVQQIGIGMIDSGSSV